METVRAFIAVDIGDEIRGKLDELQRKLKKVHADVRWVKPRRIHLTLAFLGNVAVEKLDPLKSTLDHSCQGLGAFEVEVAGTGTFGHPKHPRVVWTGIADCPPLLNLQRKVVDALLRAEVEFDNKPFAPHLTLGRVKSYDKHIESLLGKLEKVKGTSFGKVRVSEVELIKSELTPHGSEYEILHRVNLLEGSALSEPGGDEAPPSSR